MTLAEYEARMKDGQEGIYCLAGRDNVSALRASPKLEEFTAKGYEVLLMTDPVDEVILNQAAWVLPEDMKKLINIASDNVSAYTEDEKKANDEKLKEAEAEFEPLKKKVLEILGDKLESVRPSLALTSSPACLKDSAGGMSLRMENMLRAAGQSVPAQKRVLELNMSHPVVKKLLEMAKADDEKAGDVVKVLYDQSVILEGAVPEDAAGFVKRINELMTLALKDG